MSAFAPFEIPIPYDQVVFGRAHADLVTFDLSENVLSRPTPWAFPMPIGGAGIGVGALIGSVASNGVSLTIGSAISAKPGVWVALNVLLAPWLDWYVPGTFSPSAEWLLKLQAPGAGGDITGGAGGGGGFHRVAVTNIQAGGFIRFIPGMIGAGSGAHSTGASSATASRAVIYDNLTPAGDLVALAAPGLVACTEFGNIGRGGDSMELAHPELSPHIILSSYYPYDGGDSSRLDANGYACGGSSYSGGPRNIPGGGGAAGSGGGVVGASFPSGAHGLDGGMAQINIRRLS